MHNLYLYCINSSDNSDQQAERIAQQLNDYISQIKQQNLWKAVPMTGSNIPTISLIITEQSEADFGRVYRVHNLQDGQHIIISNCTSNKKNSKFQPKPNSCC